MSVTTDTGAVRTLGVDAAGRPAAVAGRTATYATSVDRIARYESTPAPASAQALVPGFHGMRVTKLTAGGLSLADTTWPYTRP